MSDNESGKVPGGDDWRRHREAAKVLGLTMGPVCVDKEHGRLYADLHGGQTYDNPIHRMDLGSALGVVYYEDFRPYRFMGVGVDPVDIEAEQDTAALFGPWGPAFKKVWPHVTGRHPIAAEHEGTIVEVLRRTKLPEGVVVVPMHTPAAAYVEIEPGVWVTPTITDVGDYEGKTYVSTIAVTHRLGSGVDPHLDSIVESTQRVVDKLVADGAITLFLYMPPTPTLQEPAVGPDGLQDGGLYWFMRLSAWGPS